jgi:hypothetical protein
MSGFSRKTQWVEVVARYLGEIVHGAFDQVSHRIFVIDGPAGLYDSPSGAAIAVVKFVNPLRNFPHTDGWFFWRDKYTDQFIDDLYRD